MLTDEQGQPQIGADNRVEIVYRPGGKSYRAALQNLVDVPGAGLPIEHDLVAQPLAEAAPSSSSIRAVAQAPSLADAIHVYTDGACTGNPGPMGIGVVILDPENSRRRELSAYLGTGTNNIAELTAIKQGLEGLPRVRPVIVYSDSSYSIGVLAKGFRARANAQLVAETRRLLSEFSRVFFVKVAGHAGIPENERCDVLAREAITKRTS